MEKEAVVSLVYVEELNWVIIDNSARARGRDFGVLGEADQAVPEIRVSEEGEVLEREGSERRECEIWGLS